MTIVFDFLIVGGDMRMKYLGQMLAQDGYRVKSILLDNGASHLTEINAENVIFPVPCCRWDSSLNAPFSDIKVLPSEIIERLGKCKCLFGGMVTHNIKELCAERGISCYDYMECEPLTVKNAEATAEGAIKVAIENTDFTLCSGRVLVAGYGRIGKILSRYLKALGADVTVEARKADDLAWIKANGYKPLPLNRLCDSCGSFDIIFNTVPFKIFTDAEVAAMNNDVVYIELASLPGGIDEESALENKIKVVKAASLPGKTAPKTSAEAIRDAVLGILKEGEM